MIELYMFNEIYVKMKKTVFAATKRPKSFAYSFIDYTAG